MKENPADVRENQREKKGVSQTVLAPLEFLRPPASLTLLVWFCYSFSQSDSLSTLRAPETLCFLDPPSLVLLLFLAFSEQVEAVGFFSGQTSLRGVYLVIQLTPEFR